MLFNTPEFGLFLIIVYTCYVLLKQSTRLQNSVLLIASYLFYSFWDYRFLSLILISTIVDYSIGRVLSNTPEYQARRRNTLLLTSICVNLGILGFFKYWNFFIDSVANSLSLLGFNPNLPLLTIILPVGISFYTFQTLSYTIDIYRGKLTAEKDFTTFALFVCYFPQLVAGPIERASSLLPRLHNPRIITSDKIASGLALMLIGLFKKVAIADMVAPFVDSGFASIGSSNWLELLLYGYLFSFQIYADFSGYTDIARGVSRLFGIELMVNFEQPYLSRNLQDFWRRWHISLSTWLRDYLYIPLGGNRHGIWNTYRNLMLTMVIGGIWHGAAWTFVIWGFIHGLFLGITRWWQSQNIGTNLFQKFKIITPLLSVIFTYHIVVLAWIFFRANSLHDALLYIQRLITMQGIPNLETSVLSALLFGFIFMMSLDWLQIRTHRQDFLLGMNSLSRAFIIALLIIGLIIWGAQTGGNQFIYFQF